MEAVYRYYQKTSVIHHRRMIHVTIFLVIFVLYSLFKNSPPPPPVKIELPVKPLKAFIYSAYYFPTSKSLGNNALALLLSINLPPTPHFSSPVFTEIVISAENSTSSIVVRTPHHKVNYNDHCLIMTIFATAQLIPNVEKIKMVSDDGMTEISFTKPSYVKRDVVVCIAPLFVSEQWQNFLFAVHTYKKYGAFVNLYLISAVNTFYNLMKEYEEAGYLTIQPWVYVKFSGIPKTIADTNSQIELRSQAAAQSDCLLQYKEAAQFITFLELEDVIIPRVAPTYVKEFQQFFNRSDQLSYIYYQRENYNAVITRYGVKFSLKNMFGSMIYKNFREAGKSVVDPLRVNYTSLHFPSQVPEIEKYIVSENVITHIKTVDWVDKIEDPNEKQVVEPLYYNGTSEKIISKKDILDLEKDFRKMRKQLQMKKILSKLPRIRYYSDLAFKCYTKIYYELYYYKRRSGITCPGPVYCKFKQHPKINCIRANATYSSMKKLLPITYYYATDHYFSEDIGCHAH